MSIISGKKKERQSLKSKSSNLQSNIKNISLKRMIQPPNIIGKFKLNKSYFLMSNKTKWIGQEMKEKTKLRD